jgi:hypothetical protein
MHDLAKQRFDNLIKEVKSLERNSQPELYSFNVNENSQDLGVRNLWRWFKKLL